MERFERIDALVEQLAEAVILHGDASAAEYAVCKLARSVGEEEEKVSGVKRIKGRERIDR
jgi:hypothetical protein